MGHSGYVPGHIQVDLLDPVFLEDFPEHGLRGFFRSGRGPPGPFWKIRDKRLDGFEGFFRIEVPDRYQDHVLRGVPFVHIIQDGLAVK